MSNSLSSEDAIEDCKHIFSLYKERYECMSPRYIPNRPIILCSLIFGIQMALAAVSIEEMGSLEVRIGDEHFIAELERIAEKGPRHVLEFDGAKFMFVRNWSGLTRDMFEELEIDRTEMWLEGRDV